MGTISEDDIDCRKPFGVITSELASCSRCVMHITLDDDD